MSILDSISGERNYQIDVWFEAGEWHARTYLIGEGGGRIDELLGAPHHDHLLNTLNYAGQNIADYEREAVTA